MLNTKLLGRSGLRVSEICLGAMTFGEDASRANWTALSLSGDEAANAETALSRISLSATIRRRISDLLTPGSTLVISDHGLGRETGKGTDFIVQPL